MLILKLSNMLRRRLRQQDHFIPLREELGLHGKEVERRVMSTLEAMSLADARDKLPGELSGGMAKRVGVVEPVMMTGGVVSAT